MQPPVKSNAAIAEEIDYLVEADNLRALLQKTAYKTGECDNLGRFFVRQPVVCRYSPGWVGRFDLIPPGACQLDRYPA